MQGHPDWLWKEQDTRPGIWGCGDGGITGPAPSLLPVAVRSHRICPQHASLAMQISSSATTMGQQIFQSDCITFMFPSPWLLPSITNHIYQPTTPPPLLLHYCHMVSIPNSSRGAAPRAPLWISSTGDATSLCGNLPHIPRPSSLLASLTILLASLPLLFLPGDSLFLLLSGSSTWGQKPKWSSSRLAGTWDLLNMACPSSASLDARTKLSTRRGTDGDPRRTDGEEKLILPIQL